ncbi:hypothetical protein VRRI112168_00270 [Vreelandella rituensis]|uniref:Uncharacterized protein n=1 Tax=Vreelandella rituensis TaxID=2282306 RepID=A0A368UB88_9GAMM|nr:hypothetical protein [Halomonas rituensis]RCV93867.1 hypothetical protein DU506_01535 [Halomonas rituensis]
MSPKFKALLIGGMALGGLYRGVEMLDLHLASLEVFQPKLTSSAEHKASPQGFYPVLVEARKGIALVSMEGVNLNEAFGAMASASTLTAPAFLQTRTVETDDEEESAREVDPINFLERHRSAFRVQALLPHQQGAIINGIAYQVGEPLHQQLKTRFSDHDGNHHFELIVPVVHAVTERKITLHARHSRGWQQEVVLTLDG